MEKNMAKSPIEIWRDGPVTNPHQPYKPDIRDWALWLESMVTSGILSSGPWFATKASMTLGYSANTIAIVYNDPTAANNGLYIKVGASGSGAWTQLTSFLPGYQFVTASPTGASAPNAIIALTSPRLPSGDGVALVTLAIAATNTASPVTVRFDDGVVLTIKTRTGEDPDAGELQQNDVVAGFVSGSTFRLISDMNSLRNAQSAKAWANNDEDVPVPATLGGDGVTTFSAKHWAARSEEDADRSEVARAGSESARDQAAGYVNDIVSEKEVPIYGTVQGLTSLLIPDGLTAFRTNGFAAMGDGGAWPLVVEVPNVGDLEPWQRLTNGGTRRWELSTSVIEAEMLGGSPTAAAALNSAAVNAAIRLQHLRGGGEVRLSKPGTYLLANTNPYNPADWGGIAEIDTSWWANRRAIWIPYDDITLRLGQGVILKVANNQTCHAIQIGQFEITVNGVLIPGISVSDCHVVGDGWEVDMNGPNQTPSTGTKHNIAGVIPSSGGTRIEVSGGWIHNSSYYGIGFEMAATVVSGYFDCHVHDMRISDCRADGFDTKDYATLSKGNVIERVHAINVGDGGDNFLSPQAGIDVRGGWRVLDCDIEFTDAFTGARVGIRVQYATDAAESSTPSLVDRCRVLGNGRNTETICYRIIGKGARVSNSQGKGMIEGIRNSIPNAGHRDNTMWDCGISFRLLGDTTAGWDSDNTELTGNTSRDSAVGLRVDTGVTGAKMLGGSMLNAPTPLVDNGTGTIIRDVAGFKTYSKVSTTIDVSTVGRKTFNISHGLPLTPGANDFKLSVARTVADGNLQWDSLMNSPPSSSQVGGELRVVTAGAAGATLQVTAEVTVKGS